MAPLEIARFPPWKYMLLFIGVIGTGVSFVVLARGLESMNIIQIPLIDEVFTTVRALEVKEGKWQGTFRNTEREGPPKNNLEALQNTYKGLEILSLYNSTNRYYYSTRKFVTTMEKDGFGGTMEGIFYGVASLRIMEMLDDAMRQRHYHTVLHLHTSEEGWKNSAHDEPNVMSTALALDTIKALDMWTQFEETEHEKLEEAVHFIVEMVDMPGSGGFRNHPTAQPTLDASLAAIRSIQKVDQWWSTESILNSLVGLYDFVSLCQVQDGSMMNDILGTSAPSGVDWEDYAMLQFLTEQGTLVTTCKGIWIREWMKRLLPSGTESWLDRMFIQGPVASTAFLQSCLGGGRLSLGGKAIANAPRHIPSLDAIFEFFGLVGRFPQFPWGTPRWISVSIEMMGYVVLLLCVPLAWVGAQLHWKSMMEDGSLVSAVSFLLMIASTMAYFFPYLLLPDLAYVCTVLVIALACWNRYNRLALYLSALTSIVFVVVTVALVSFSPNAFLRVSVLYLLRVWHVVLVGLFQVGMITVYSDLDLNRKPANRREKREARKSLSRFFPQRQTWITGAVMAWAFNEFALHGALFLQKLHPVWVQHAKATGHWFGYLWLAPTLSLGWTMMLTSALHRSVGIKKHKTK